jgi:hypothetical protein
MTSSLCQAEGEGAEGEEGDPYLPLCRKKVKAFISDTLNLCAFHSSMYPYMYLNNANDDNN